MLQRYTDQFEMKAVAKDSFDPTEYFLNPNKITFDEVEAYVTALFTVLPEGASYYDNIYNYPIHSYYQEIRHQREDIHCPLILGFWITEEEKDRVAREINIKIRGKRPVFLSQFVYSLLESRLQFQTGEEIRIEGLKILSLS